MATTIAFTLIGGGEAVNVIPGEAWVIGDMRCSHHQGQESSIKAITKVAEKFGLETEVIYKGFPSKALDLNGEAFAITQSTIGKIFPGVGILPYVVTGGTDARFYGEVCDNCVRFSPVNYGPEQMAGMHGLNENIECNCLPPAVDFNKTIITAQENR